MNTKQADHPTLVIIRGMPGGGKSYLVAELQRPLRQSAGQENVVILDPDATDYDSDAYKAHVKAQLAEGVDPKLHPYRFLRAQAYQAIEDHKTIVWDQALTNPEMFRKMIDRLQDHATEHGTVLSILIVEVAISPDLAKERVAQRKRAGGHGPSEATLAQRIADYKSYADQGFHTVTVRGDGNVGEAAAAVMRALRDL